MLLAKARAIILTDIDGSMIGYDGSRDGVKDAVELLNALNVVIVPVTAKTLYEVSYLGEELGFSSNGLIAVVEMGGAICASKGYLGFVNSFEVNGFECEVLGGFIEEFEDLIDNALGKCNTVRLSKASLEEAENILGLKGVEALLATKRFFLEVVWSNNRECLEGASRKLEKLGLKTLMGRRFLHIGLHKGKGEATARLLHIINPLIKGRLRVIGIGDSEADTEFLELVDKPIIIPQRDLTHSISLRRSDYIITPYPAPQGWIWAVRQISLSLA